MDAPGSTGSYQPWFERWPELVEWERQRFEAWGLPWAIDEDRLAHGYLVIHSRVEYQGRPVAIRAEYPSETPELPPVVYSDTIILDRHQQPFGGNFCLLARPEDDWNAKEWGAADLIGRQLLKLLSDSEAGEATVRANEAPVPEPRSATYMYAERSVVLIPGNVATPTGEAGTFTARMFDRGRAIVTRVDGERGDPRLVDGIAGDHEMSGRWVRLDDAPPAGPCGNDVLRWLRTNHPGLGAPQPVPAKLRRSPRLAAKAAPALVALVYPEEALPDGTTRAAWMFLLIDQFGGSAELLHAQIVSPEERSRRTPELARLIDQTAIVVGAGSLGGEVAVQLARAGIGRLHLVDYDRFEANNAVRHVVGVDQAGLQKIEAVTLACRRANPFCEIAGHDHLRFGDTVGPPPLERLHRMLDDAHIVVETTGVNQLQLLIARAAWEQGVPVISCWLTDGSWAGEVSRLIRGRTVCAPCFMERQITRQVLAGEASPDAAVYAQGCTHPTTTGAGFDASEVAAIAARLVAGTLPGDYPGAEWDHAVVNFRRMPDDPTHPRFAVEKLSQTHGCPTCGLAAG